MSLTIHEDLVKAGTKYRKELLVYPMLELADVLAHMNLRTGIQGKEIGGSLDVDAELRPYRTAKDATGGPTITPFEWEVFLGDTVKEFDPHAILGTLYTEPTGAKPDAMQIARKVAFVMAGKVGEALRAAMFKAARNPLGNTTLDLFNGFSTLAENAIDDELISVAKKNLTDLTSTPLSGSNVGDVLKTTWRALPVYLKRRPIKLYMPVSILEMYEDWFQVEYGHAPWNDGFGQRYLIGSDRKCELVPLDNMEGQPFMFFSQRENFLVGVDQVSDKETVEIRRPDNPKLVQFFMKSHFGTGFDTLDHRFFHAVKFTLAEEGD
ncbi:MAG TPA: hypothetical protein PKE03_10330 [Bacteroidales bacterium]|nr:hypothetical protein [Bacteroidales bacterium]